jgi:hypothetical protein
MKEPSENRHISSRINQSQPVRIRPVETQYPEETAMVGHFNFIYPEAALYRLLFFQYLNLVGIGNEDGRKVQIMGNFAFCVDDRVRFFHLIFRKP